MTITEQLRLKLETADEELDRAHHNCSIDMCAMGRMNINEARRILREICELEGEHEE